MTCVRVHFYFRSFFPFQNRQQHPFYLRDTEVQEDYLVHIEG